MKVGDLSMRRFISLLFTILLLFCCLGSIAYSSDMPPIESGNFIYFYEDTLSFEGIEKVLKEYNEKYGYSTDREFKIKTSEDEIILASFDEEKVIVYVDDFNKSRLKDKDKMKHLKEIYDLLYESLYIEEDFVLNFISELNDFDSEIGAIMLPFIFSDVRTSYPYQYIIDFIKLLNLIFIFVGIFILLWYIYYLRKHKKEKLLSQRKYVCYLIFSIIFLLYWVISYLFILQI